MEERNIQSVKVQIWQASSLTRELLPDLQMQQVIVAFTILRRIDCLIGKYAIKSAAFYTDNRKTLSDERLDEKLCEISGGHPFYNYSGYNFERILMSPESIEVVMNSYFQGFSDNVVDALEGMNFIPNLAMLQRQSRYLVDLIEFFVQLDLSENSLDNEEFIEIISSLFDDRGRMMGEFCTNYELSNLITDCLLSEDLRNGKEDYVSIYDPVCGTGGMLALAGVKAKSFAIHQSHVCLYGQEIANFPYAIAKALVMFSGNELSAVLYGNTLSEDRFCDIKFQYILADIPFGLRWKAIQDRIEMESVDHNGRFSIGLPSVNDSLFLHVENIISKMDPRGSRAAFITNPAILWAGDARSGESRIRRWMFEHDYVETIIALPAGSHTVANIPIYLWILSNKKSEAQKGKVRLIDASSMKSKNRRKGLDSELVKTIVDEYKSNIISIRSQIVRNEQFGYYEVDLLENGKKKERVTISLDTDINEFVKKERQPYAKGEITIDYSSVEKGYTIQFEKFFVQETNEIPSLSEATCDMLTAIDIVASLKMDIIKIEAREEAQTWKEYPLCAVAGIILGGPKPIDINTEGLPLLSVSYLRKPSDNEPLYAITSRSKCATPNDTIVIVRGENAGEVFKGVDGILSSSVAAIKSINENAIISKYLYYLLKGNENTLRSLAKGVAQKSLDSKSMLSLKCSIPPIEVQKKIVSNIDDVVGKIDKIIEYTGNTDNVFATYRQTLIENAVRGKLKIS